MSVNSMNRIRQRMIDVLLSAVIACIILWLAAGCNVEMEYSPWEWDVPDSGLTEKNIQKLSLKSEPEFTPFSIAVAGDSQMGISGLRNIVDNLNSMNDIAFLVIAGDLTDLGLAHEYTWVYDSIRKFRGPVLTVIGNHDGLNNGPEIYRELFGRFNYTFQYNGVQFIMWNNNYYEFGTPDFEWLENQVAGGERNVIISHIPPYSGILPDHFEEEWRLIRQQPSVLASIHGHVHDFRLNFEDGWLPIFTVERTEDGEFGVVTFNEDNIVFSKCKNNFIEEIGRCYTDIN